MNTELIVLFLAVVLGTLQILLAAAAITKQRGLKWNLSSRDGNPPPLSGNAERMDRALQNFKETFPLFLAAIFLVIATNRTGNVSAVSACVYIFARALYFPIYVLDITVVRSLVWGISVLGIVGILLQLFI